jgi:hypothetical protein
MDVNWRVAGLKYAIPWLNEVLLLSHVTGGDRQTRETEEDDHWTVIALLRLPWV